MSLESEQRKTIQIADHKIGMDYPPFIVAEMSGNHNQSLGKALEIVDAAAKAGAHALKLQTYSADTLTLNISDGDFYISDKNSLWKDKSLYELYQQAHTPWEWHKSIFERCHKNGMIAFSTPFDETAADFLNELGVPCFKIASFENIHLPLIRKVAKFGKPVIVSTGMASVSELEDAVTTIRESGNEQIVLLKCTSSYPSSPLNSNILTIPHLRELFHCQVGLSDHSMGIGVAVASVALGATIIEKHFTLDRSQGGVDSAFSMEPQEMAALVIESERAWQSLGRVTYGVTAGEKKSLVFRRSIYAAEDIKAGEKLTEKNLRIVRPGHGLAPKFMDIVLGKVASQNISKGTAISWNLVS